MKRVGMLLLGALTLLAGMVSGPAAHANGVPQLVKLTFLPGVSTWGPENGEGVLEFSFAEAYARVDVKNLDPQDGYSYEGWLVAPTGLAYRVGEIQVTAAGSGTLETKLTDLEGYDYNLFVVAGRSGDDPADAMPDRRSIAGRFTIISDTPGGTNGDVRPSELPQTGEQRSDNTVERAALGAGFALAVAGVGLLARQKMRRRSTS